MRRSQTVLADTGIRTLRSKPVFTTPNVFPSDPLLLDDDAAFDDQTEREVLLAQHCYVCKQKYAAIHHFYDQLCPSCGEFNFRKRTETADLRGRVALLTGGRVKIGYQAGIKLLRAGADLIVTTRFPRDSATRYAQEPDFEEWGDRLEIYGLDLRHTPSVEAFCHHVGTTRDRLDYVINNACQTVRRPPEFYRHMMERETGSLRDLPAHVQALLGGYEGLRGYRMLASGQDEGAVEFHDPAVDACATHADRHPLASPAPPSSRRNRYWRRSSLPVPTCSRSAGSIRISSRSICATGTHGG